jgi:hypothetical protein
MALVGNLSSVNLIAGAGILGNVGGIPIMANTDLGNSISSYTSVTVVSRFASIAASGYINQNAVANSFPALTNAVPTAYQGNLGSATLTSTVNTEVTNILGNGDLGKFDQVIGPSQNLVEQTNQLVRTALNANAATNSFTFFNQDNIITGGLSQLTQAFRAFGEDLLRLGNLIDLANLPALGDPISLLRQIAYFTNIPPGLNTALLEAGIPEEAVADPANYTWSEQQQKLVYQVMTQITGNDLAQVLKLLKVTTPNIQTMSDLLNPVKIFPSSFNTLTAPTNDGIRGIYLNSTGAINSNLETTLPASVLAPLQGNPLQNLPGTPQL